MTDGDRMFLASLVASHKRVIDEDCRAKKLDRSAYFKRAQRAERKAREIEQSFARPRRF